MKKTKAEAAGASARRVGRRWHPTTIRSFGSFDLSVAKVHASVASFASRHASSADWIVLVVRRARAKAPAPPSASDATTPAAAASSSGALVLPKVSSRTPLTAVNAAASGLPAGAAAPPPSRRYDARRAAALIEGTGAYPPAAMSSGSKDSASLCAAPISAPSASGSKSVEQTTAPMASARIRWTSPPFSPKITRVFTAASSARMRRARLTNVRRRVDASSGFPPSECGVSTSVASASTRGFNAARMFCSVRPIDGPTPVPAGTSSAVLSILSAAVRPEPP